MGKINYRKVLSILGIIVVVLVSVMAVFGFNPLKSDSFVAASNSTGETSRVEANVQTIETALTSSDYPVITVQKGIPVRWIIQADASALNSCNDVIVIPEFGIENTLKPGENIIEFTPEESGILPYSCWMGMINSQINVVEDVENASSSDIDNLQVIGATSGSGRGCCSLGGSTVQE